MITFLPSLHLCPVPRHWPPRRIPNRFNEWPIHLVTWNKVLFQGTSNIMCWLGDWIRLIHPMHWFQSLLRSNRRLKPQISHGFLAPFEGFPDASPSVLQVWENVGIQVIMGLSTGIPMARRLPPPIMGLSTGIPMARRLQPQVPVS